MHVRSALLVVVTLALAAPGARAQGSLFLTWQDCATGGGLSDGVFGCNTDINEFPIVPAFTLTQAVDSVFAAEMVLDVDVASDTLPSWWRMAPGECRMGALAADVAATSCADPWGGQGVAEVQGYLEGQPYMSPHHVRILVAVGVPSSAARALAAGTPYTLCRIVLRTIATSTCAGCSVPACFVLESIELLRLPGASPPTVTLASGMAPQNWITWLGGAGASCGAVPVRHTTWGAVKALYR